MEKASAKSKHNFIHAVGMLTAGLSVISLVSCAAEPPQPMVFIPTTGLPAAGTVNVLESSVANPLLSMPNCHLQGHVLVRTVDRFEPINLAVTPIEVAELKNKTLQLNANTVVIRKNYLLRERNMFVHVVKSDAYACYSSAY